MKDKLQRLGEEVKSCQRCRLREGCRQTVFGEGEPGLLVIGEGPGADEDIQGRPFVGKAGQLLDQILASCGFDRQRNAFIANVVKCRPPENRAPLPDEAEACLPFLYRQIELMNPKIIMLLGATALRYVLSMEGITKARGHFVEKDGLLYMPTFHPAALLRDPSKKKEVWLDVQQVFHKYRELVDADHTSPYIK